MAESTARAAMTPAEYRALEAAYIEKKLEILRLLDRAGVAHSTSMLNEFLDALFASERALRELTHEERMAIYAEDKEKRQQLLAYFRARETARAVAS